MRLKAHGSRRKVEDFKKMNIECRTSNIERRTELKSRHKGTGTEDFKKMNMERRTFNFQPRTRTKGRKMAESKAEWNMKRNKPLGKKGGAES